MPILSLAPSVSGRVSSSSSWCEGRERWDRLERWFQCSPWESALGAGEVAGEGVVCRNQTRYAKPLERGSETTGGSSTKNRGSPALWRVYTCNSTGSRREPSGRK